MLGMGARAWYDGLDHSGSWGQGVYGVETNKTTVSALIGRALEKGQTALSEFDGKRVFEAYGIPVVEERLAGSIDEAVAAADALGYPVVVKACSPVLAHKTDAGLVTLNVMNADCVRRAVETIAAAAGRTPLDGFLIQRMVEGQREVIVGGLRDPLFGPCVMVGLGGVLVEAIADVAFRLVPIERLDALEMLAELKGRRLFGAVRGEPPIDRDATSDVLIAVGRILDEQPTVAQIDVNPIIFDGAQPVAVDALITLARCNARVE